MCATGTLPVASQIRIARRTDAASLHHSRRLGNSTLSARIAWFLIVVRSPAIHSMMAPNHRL